MCDFVLSCFLVLDQGSQTRGPHVAHEGVFLRPTMLFGNFQVINIYVI